MDFRFNGKTLLGIVMISSGIVLADFVSIIDTKSTGGITVTGGMTESEVNAAIQTAVDTITAEYNSKILALENTINENKSSYTTLWSGAINGTADFSLSDSATNYDMIQVHATGDYVNGYTHHFTRNFLVDDMKAGHRYNIQQTEIVSGHYINIWFDYNSATSLKSHVMGETSNWSNVYITKVYGIKY